MRTGVIVYVMEKNFPFDQEPNLAEDIRRHYKADGVEIVSCGQKHFDVMDAWWKLTTRGMQRFICVFAGYAGTSTPVEPRRHLRVCR